MKNKQKKNRAEVNVNNDIKQAIIDIDNSITEIDKEEGGVAISEEQTQQKRIVELTAELRRVFKQKESCHYARYIKKHHYNVIDAVNEAFDNFVRNDDVLANKEYFAKAIEAKTKLSAETFKSTAYDVLCEFEKFVNAHTDEDIELVKDTRGLLREGVALALMTTQTQTNRHRNIAEQKQAEQTS